MVGDVLVVVGVSVVVVVWGTVFEVGTVGCTATPERCSGVSGKGDARDNCGDHGQGGGDRDRSVPLLTEPDPMLHPLPKIRR